MIRGAADKVLGVDTNAKIYWTNDAGNSYTAGAIDALTHAIKISGSDAVTISSSGATGMRFNGYGAGALTTDASGNITATSDERMKDIQGAYTRGLADILKIKPITYRWKKSSGLETEHDYSGFGAQDVQRAIPEAIGQNPDGSLTLQDRPLIAALVNAIKELNAKVSAIA